MKIKSTQMQISYLLTNEFRVFNAKFDKKKNYAKKAFFGPLRSEFCITRFFKKVISSQPYCTQRNQNNNILLHLNLHQNFDQNFEQKF